MDNMRPPAQPFVTEHRAQKQLNIKNENREQSQSEQAGAASIKFDARLLFHPAASGKDGDGDGDTEKCLRNRGVSARDRGRKKKQHGESAEYALGNDGSKSAQRQK